jgi:pentatricopeptide repeat protein
LSQASAAGKSFDPTAGVVDVLAQPTSHIQPITQSLTDRGVLADRRMFALRIRHEAVTKGDMTSAKGIFQMMLDRGLHPNEYHYAALMEGHAAAGEMTAAEAVMNSAERGGVRPNCVLHTILIVGYARRKNSAGAMRILRHMVASGVRPDVPAIDAITSAFFACGARRLARQTLLSLWPSVAPLPRDHDKASLKVLVSHLRNLHKGRIISTKLSENERQVLVGKLEELSKIWSLSGTQQGSTMYVKGHSTLRRELSQPHLS